MTPSLAPAREGHLILLLAALVAFGPLAIDLYLPALPAIAAGLKAPAEAVQLTITLFLAGFCLGMLGYGPLSDRYGRRPLLLGGITLFVVASLACVIATSVEQLVVARFLQALGGGAASILARAVVRDRFVTTEAVRVLALMAMITAVAPLLAPLIGSTLLAVLGWRGTFGALLAWGLISLLVVWRHLPESLPQAQRGQLSLGAAFAAYGRVLLDPAAIGLILSGGMSFAAMFSYITASPFYFIDFQHFSPTAYGLVFAANAVGIFAVNFVNSRLVRSRGPLWMAGIGAATSLAGALLLWLSVHHDNGLPGVLAGLFLVASMTGLLGANCVGPLMARYPDNAGAAAALFGAGQFGLGMLSSAATSYFHAADGSNMALIIVLTTALSVAGWMLHHRHRNAGAGR